MKSKNKRKCFFMSIVFVLALLGSCRNKYESVVVGKYEVSKYEIADSIKSFEYPILFLEDDNTFLLASKAKKIRGKWEADDDGDRTWIRFYFNSITSDGVIGGNKFNLIEIWNPQDFGYPFLKNIVFEKKQLL